MKDADRQTRSHLMELFRRLGFHPRTDLGQNFLIDLNLVEYIVRQAELTRDDVVLEVGSGTGGLTTFLAGQAGAVVSVEIDRNMYTLASAATAGLENVTLLRTDILRNKNNLSEEVLDVLAERLGEDPARELKLVSNLPYNVATPVVSNLVATELDWKRMVVTIQLELGEKMAARPGEASYGALSVWLQSQCAVRILKRPGPQVFWPRPKVHSAIVRLLPKPTARERIGDRRFLLDFLRRLFHQRRKLLRSVVVGMYRKQLSRPEVDAVLAEFALPDGVRAEQLDVPVLVALCDRVRRAVLAASLT